MYVGIVGSRRRTSISDCTLILNEIQKLMSSGEKIVLVSGGCKKGADLFAEEFAKQLGLEIIIFKPDLTNCYERYEFTKSYYARNKQIAEKSDILIACVSEDRKGGTENTIKEFLKSKPKEKLILI